MTFKSSRRGIQMWRQRMDGILGRVSWPDFLLRDEFTINEAAPLASPRTCEPGPGELLITDASNVMPIVGNELTLSGNAAAATGVVHNGGIARAIGRTMYIICTRHQGIGWNRWGWSIDQPMNSNSEFLLWWQNVTELAHSDGAANSSPILTVANNETDTPMALVLRSTGGFILDNVTGTWRLDWLPFALNTATVYGCAGVAAASAGVDMNFDSMRIFDMAAPWDTDYGIVTQQLAGARAPGDIFTHEANCLIEFTVDTLPGAGQIELWFRIQDATNYWAVTVDNAGNLDLDEVVAGVPVQRGTAAGVVANGERILIVAENETINVWEQHIRRINYALAVNFKTETDGELDTEGAGGAVSDIVSWPRYLSGAAASTLNRFTF